MPLKQSLCVPCYLPEGMDLSTFCGRVARIGYAAVEIWGRDEGFDELMKAVKDNGLALASMCGHASLEDGLNRASNHERIESELIASIDIAATHDIPGLICFSGNRNAGQTDEEAIEVVAAGLRRVSGHAEAKGVNLNLELLNSTIDHPGYQCDHTEWGVKVCRRVGSPRVKLLYDIYHMAIMEGDLIRTISEHIDYIGHFHTAGNPGRHEFDDSQELNYAGICRAIDRTGYRLYLGHEFFPTRDPFTSLAQAFDICNPSA